MMKRSQRTLPTYGKLRQPPHIMVVVANFYQDISDALVQGAIAELDRVGATHEVVEVAGSLEIPAAIQYAIKAVQLNPQRKRYDGYVALGCVIRGETTHYEIVCRESASGLQQLAMSYTLAIGNGILTVENEAQAWARAKASEMNKGGEAAIACLVMLELKRKFGLYPRP